MSFPVPALNPLYQVLSSPENFALAVLLCSPCLVFLREGMTRAGRTLIMASGSLGIGLWTWHHRTYFPDWSEPLYSTSIISMSLFSVILYDHTLSVLKSRFQYRWSRRFLWLFWILFAVALPLGKNPLPLLGRQAAVLWSHPLITLGILYGISLFCILRAFFVNLPASLSMSPDSRPLQGWSAAVGLGLLGGWDLLSPFPTEGLGILFGCGFSLGCSTVGLCFGLQDLLPSLKPRNILDESPDPVVVCDRGGKIRYHNQSYKEAFPNPGYPSTHQHIDPLLEQARNFDSSFDQLMEQTPLQNRLLAFPDSGDGTLKVSLSAGPIESRDHYRSGLIMCFRRLPPRGDLAHQIRDSTLYDDLTDLPNRHFLQQRLDRAIRRSRYQSDRSLALLEIGLDRFKLINENLGHSVGDRLLEQVAQRLSKIAPGGDLVARVGGDEFAILIENLSERHNALDLADRIHERFESPFSVDEQEIYLSTSIGIGVTQGQEDSNVLIGRASRALREVKRRAETRTELFGPRSEDGSMNPVLLESHLRRAIKRNEFELHFQPILELETRHLVGMEALARWRHPDRGLVSPGQFIPLTEATGLIIPLGRLILRDACRHAMNWPNDVLRFLPRGMHVNISGNHLLHRNFLDDVEHALSDSGMKPYHLTLEITESVLISQLEHARSALLSIQETGVNVCLDDFGTGFSSLKHLSNWPVESMKIDKSFVIDLEDSPPNQVLLRSFIALAQQMEMELVAEGVESQTASEKLQQWGCRLGQGFYFSRPLSPDDTQEYLKSASVQKSDRSKT